MKYPSKLILSGLAVLPLSACGGLELGKAQGVTHTGPAFDLAPYAGYISPSENEYKEGD